MTTLKKPRRKIMSRLSHVVAGMGSSINLMPASSNRYRRYTTRIKIKSFEHDHLVFRSDQEKVGADIRKAVDSLEKRRLVNQHE
ncbi:MAG: hypothetical protein RI580_17450 [Halothece sp. Uz-M2-17]|nr:hypothetical protein [Halothece sp. Uz-M2-17]